MLKEVSTFKKILLIFLTTITVIFVSYVIGSIKILNSADLNLHVLVDNIYQDKQNKYYLTFDNVKSLYLNCPIKAGSDEKAFFTLDIETKGNCFVAKNEETKFVFIPLSDDRIYIQNRNVILYNSVIFEEVVE